MGRGGKHSSVTANTCLQVLGLSNPGTPSTFRQG